MQLELRRLVALNPNVQFAIRRVFSEDIERKKKKKKMHTSFTI